MCNFDDDSDMGIEDEMSLLKEGETFKLLEKAWKEGTKETLIDNPSDCIQALTNL
jgi:hypothetical protein